LYHIQFLKFFIHFYEIKELLENLHGDPQSTMLNKLNMVTMAVATFEATEAAASVVFTTVASVKTITSTS